MATMYKAVRNVLLADGSRFMAGGLKELSDEEGKRLLESGAIEKDSKPVKKRVSKKVDAPQVKIKSSTFVDNSPEVEG